MKKTNAMRILDSLSIPYETKEYDDDGEHLLHKGAALELSEKLGINPECVFKTIVMRTDSKEPEQLVEQKKFILSNLKNFCRLQDISAAAVLPSE